MTEVRQRHRVGLAADLPPSSHRVVRAGNRELGIFNIGGTLHALFNCAGLPGPPFSDVDTAAAALARWGDA